MQEGESIKMGENKCRRISSSECDRKHTIWGVFLFAKEENWPLVFEKGGVRVIA